MKSILLIGLTGRKPYSEPGWKTRKKRRIG
jgi:hypothetical protein